MYPAVKPCNLYSLHLYHELDILFDIQFQNIFTFDEKYIRMVGYKLSDSTYIVNENGYNITIEYTCPKEVINTGMEYLQQIYKNTIPVQSSYSSPVQWNPVQYKPELI